MKKIKKLLFITIFLFAMLTGCIIPFNNFVIEGGESITIEVGEEYHLEIEGNFLFEDEIVWITDGLYFTIDQNGVITALKEGQAIVTAVYKNTSDDIIVNVISPKEKIDLKLRADKYEGKIGEIISLDASVYPTTYKGEITFEIISGKEYAIIEENVVSLKEKGTIMVIAKVKDISSNTIIISIKDDIEISDPYESMSKEEFYENYEPATSYMDSYYRTQHGLMSGSIEEQDQAPTIAKNQPKENGVLLRNSFSYYSDDGNTYYILDSYGKICNQVYKNGAYVTLEEVAAYVFAFGDVPKNYLEKKSGSPSSSIWGEYLRLNHSVFTGDTLKYPYEPELPNINGCGGDLTYYEIDLGTTGTDCDPSYDAKVYNDGRIITRGAARIVYARYDKNKNEIIDINEKYLFYTYNHYNDFQEYLNYENGWGKIFGNITGGGTISSKSDYNPTPYVETKLKDFTALTIEVSSEININYYIFIDKKRKYC